MLPKFEQHEIQTIHKDIDGTIQTSYIFQDHPCPAIDISSDIGTQCAGLQLIIKDLELALSCLTTASKLLEKILTESHSYRFDLTNSEHIILWSLYSSALVTYAKGFTESKGRKANVDHTIFEQFPIQPGRPTLLELHYKVMDLRHEWISHCGANDNERGKTIALLDPHDVDSRRPTILYHVVHRSIPKSEEVDELYYVCLAVRDVVRLRLQTKERLLNRVDMAPKKLKEWKLTAKKYITFGIK